MDWPGTGYSTFWKVCTLSSQVQQAGSKLRSASIGGLFRGVGGSGSTNDVTAPEELSSCVGNWLSHLDWDGDRCAIVI